MVELGYDTAGSSYPGRLMAGLECSVVPAVLDGSACSGPLSHDTAGIMGPIAVYGSVIHTVTDGPAAGGGIVLVSDDAARETVRIRIGQLTAYKGPVYQIAQILFGLVHTDDTAGTYAQSIGLVHQEPVSGYALLQGTGGGIVGSDTAQIAIGSHTDIHPVRRHFFVTFMIGQVLHLGVIGPVYPILILIPIQALCPGLLIQQRQSLPGSLTLIQHIVGHHVRRNAAAGQFDGALVEAGDAAQHTIGRCQTAVRPVFQGTASYDAVLLVLSGDAARVAGEAFLLCRGAGTGGRIHALNVQGELSHTVALQTAAVDTRDAAVAISRRSALFPDSS